jgi:redox-sensing transcriptional repressor
MCTSPSRCRRIRGPEAAVDHRRFERSLGASRRGLAAGGAADTLFGIMGVPPRISRPTASRISLYLRELEARRAEGEFTVRSRQIGESLGLTDAQVRKDLACLGQLGQAGVGYRIDDLLQRLRTLAGVDRGWIAVLVGIGNIGRALLSYGRFEQEGFRIGEVFDCDPAKVGTVIAGRHVLPLERLGEIVARDKVGLGIIATPAEAAQQVADALVAAGVEGLLNFAPRRLELPRRVVVSEVDLTMSLAQLALLVSLSRDRNAAPLAEEAT